MRPCDFASAGSSYYKMWASLNGFDPRNDLVLGSVRIGMGCMNPVTVISRYNTQVTLRMQLFFLQYAKMVAGDLVVFVTSLYLYVTRSHRPSTSPTVFAILQSGKSSLLIQLSSVFPLLFKFYRSMQKQQERPGKSGRMYDIPLSTTSDLRHHASPWGLYDHVFNSHQTMEVQRVNESGKKVCSATLIY